VTGTGGIPRDGLLHIMRGEGYRTLVEGVLPVKKKPSDFSQIIPSRYSGVESKRILSAVRKGKEAGFIARRVVSGGTSCTRREVSPVGSKEKHITRGGVTKKGLHSGEGGLTWYRAV